MVTNGPKNGGEGRFGERLRRLREEAGLTQEELAAKAGMTAKGVSALERGERKRPYPHTVRSLADALGLDDERRAGLISTVPKRGAETRASPTAPSKMMPTPDGGHVVPAPSTSLLGRERELGEALDFLSRPGTRLLTLTGTGGVGKTRLALALAAEAERSGRFPDGVVFVELAPVGDPSLVNAAIARTLEAGVAEGRSLGDDPQPFLRDRKMLLVLDNFEQVSRAALGVAALVEACEGLTVLVTSRAPLRVRGEQEYPVEPLGLPFSTLSADVETVLASPSGRLFVERARAASPTFEVTAENAPAVAAICWRLAGLPLALELAAAKARFLDPPSLLARLDRALSGGWARDLPERQRTMRSALDWSYDLLTAEEQTLFRRLAVFVGGASLEAAEAIFGDAGDVLEVLGGLVEQSLVTTGSDGVSRYGMLEPVRQYALEKLEEAGEADETRRRHAAFFLEMAEGAFPELLGPRQVEGLAALDLENDNLRAVMEWALEAGEAETAARLGWALWPFLRIHGHQREGRRWMETTLRHDLVPYWRGRAANVARAMAYAQGDYEACERYARICLEVALQTGDTDLEGYGWVGIGLAALNLGDYETATSSMEKAYPLLDASGQGGMAPIARIWLGTALLAQGEPQQATKIFEEGISLARRVGDRVGIYIALYNMSQVTLAREDYEGASTLFEEGVTLSEQTGDAANLAYFLQGLSVVAGALGDARRMARLMGAAEGMFETANASVYNYYLPERTVYGRAEARARESLGDAAFEEARVEGRAMTFKEAVAYALDTGKAPADG